MGFSVDTVEHRSISGVQLYLAQVLVLTNNSPNVHRACELMVS